MKLQLLPSTFADGGASSGGQHLTCFVINDEVAIDAGSLAFAVNDHQRSRIRDVILTHAHLDHIAGLPLFLDDLFATLEQPIRIHGSREVLEVLERDVFNWSVYPKFSELTNEHGPILEYRPFETGKLFDVAGLKIRPIKVNHKVPSSGFIIEEDGSVIALSGDTSEMDGFWDEINGLPRLDALLIECAFPDAMKELAEVSHHLTPSKLDDELSRFTHEDCPIYAVNLKPMYRKTIAKELESAVRREVSVLEVGRVYEF